MRWFNRLYLDVTLAVRQYCQSEPLAAPPFLEQLDVLFANLFFAAFDAATADAAVPDCWAPCSTPAMTSGSRRCSSPSPA